MLQTIVNAPALPTASGGDDRQGKVIKLRALLSQKFPPAAVPRFHEVFPTGIKAMDNPLGGGLPKAAITELIRPRHTMGSATCVSGLIKAVQASGKFLALVDGGNSFDTAGLSNDELSALLLVRCRKPEEPIIAADLLLRDGNLPLVVIDLTMCPAKQIKAIPSASWYRLQRVAEDNGTAALVLTPFRSVAAAACTLQFGGGFKLKALDVLFRKNVTAMQVESLRARANPNSLPQLPAATFAVA